MKHILVFVLLFTVGSAFAQKLESHIKTENKYFKKNGYSLHDRRNSWSSENKNAKYVFGKDYLFVFITKKGHSCYPMRNRMGLRKKGYGGSRDVYFDNAFKSLPPLSNENFFVSGARTSAAPNGKYSTLIFPSSSCDQTNWVLLIYRK